MLYESKISVKRWMAYDLAGNAGWIIYFVCLGLLLKQGVNVLSVVAVAPAILMLIGIVELISERIRKLDWVLPKARLYRGFGALALGGVMGMLLSAGGLLWHGAGLLVWLMLAGSALCAVFAWLLFREYKPKEG
ncbi:MAG: hypothetical protein IJ769_12665 [Clostridia bacterium]|nr:hypothetical protein [Clostridia bacterium]